MPWTSRDSYDHRNNQLGGIQGVVTPPEVLATTVDLLRAPQQKVRCNCRRADTTRAGTRRSRALPWYPSLSATLRPRTGVSHAQPRPLLPAARNQQNDHCRIRPFSQRHRRTGSGIRQTQGTTAAHGITTTNYVVGPGRTGSRTLQQVRCRPTRVAIPRVRGPRRGCCWPEAA